MRITITGASSVGKTSLAELLSIELRLPLIPELARELCQQKGHQKIGTIPDQEGFKREVLEAQIAREESLGYFVADRSAFDTWVLWQRWNLCSAMTYDTEKIYDLAKAQSQKYTHIIYIPPLIAISEDDFRWTDRDYQKQVDRIIRTTLYDFNLLDRTHTIQSTELNERLHEAWSWIDRGK